MRLWSWMIVISLGFGYCIDSSRANEQKIKVSFEFRGESPSSESASYQPKQRVSQFIFNVLKDKKPYQSSQIDLVGVVGEKDTVWIPRFFLQKYDVVFEKKSEGLKTHFQKRESKMDSENLPHEVYEVLGIKEVILSSLDEKFSSLRLSHRADPKLLRGERIAMNSCMGCHSGWVEKESPAFLSKSKNLQSHPAVQYYPEYSSLDQRSLKAYFETIQSSLNTRSLSSK